MKETNMEHYRGEIEEILLEGVVFGLSKEYGTIDWCHKIGCANCDFMEKGINCDVGMVKWLMSEYKPEPVLTAKEKHFVEFVQKGWLARDKNNAIFWHGAEPKKYDHSWGNDCLKYARVDSYDREMFLFITWKDEEPWAVADLRKLKALEYNPEDVTFPKGGSDENSNV